MCSLDNSSVRDPGTHDPGVQVSGEGPLVVLVPGMDGTGRLFYRQVPLLARRFRVVTYKLRDSAPDMDTLVNDLAQIIQSVAPGERATIIGESFGGTVAMSFAIARPNLAGALVILNSFPRFLPQLRLHIAILGLRLMPWGAMKLVRRLTAFRMHSRHTHKKEIRRFLEETRQTTRDGYINRLRILTTIDLRKHLDKIEAPTLILASDEDHLVPSVEQGKYMAARVPRAVLRILGGHGHVCLIAPDVDLERILAEWERPLF